MVRGDSGALTLQYDAAGGGDEVLVFAKAASGDGMQVCRFPDSGQVTIPASAASDLGLSDDPVVALYRVDKGWKPGPDGLPVRMQGFSGITVPVD